MMSLEGAFSGAFALKLSTEGRALSWLGAEIGDGPVHGCWKWGILVQVLKKLDGLLKSEWLTQQQLAASQHI